MKMKLSKCSAIQLGSCGVNDDSAMPVLEAFAIDNTCTTFLFNNNLLKDAGVKKLAQSLEQNVTLHTLDIRSPSSAPLVTIDGHKFINALFTENVTIRAYNLIDIRMTTVDLSSRELTESETGFIGVRMSQRTSAVAMLRCDQCK